jgi:H-NS histone family
MPTLEQIQRKVKQLQARAEALIAKHAQTVLTDIRKLMDEHGLTTADIEAHAATKKRAGRPAGAASAKVACLDFDEGQVAAEVPRPENGRDLERSRTAARLDCEGSGSHEVPDRRCKRRSQR